MAVSIEQAAINALATYLQAQLGTDVVVSGVWPNPDEPIPEKALTILKIGARRETKVDPSLVSSAELSPPDPTAMLYTWRVKAIEQDIQLDVWSRYEDVRDDLQARLDQALNQGLAATLSPDILHDDFRDGLLLTLGDGHPGYADFIFDGPEITDLPDAAQRNEFRSTQTGTLSAMLTITKQQPRMANITLRMTANGNAESFSTP